MIATLKASARSRGSDESLPNIGRPPQTQRDNANAMVIEEIIDDEATPGVETFRD